MFTIRMSRVFGIPRFFAIPVLAWTVIGTDHAVSQETVREGAQPTAFSVLDLPAVENRATFSIQDTSADIAETQFDQPRGNDVPGALAATQIPQESSLPLAQASDLHRPVMELSADIMDRADNRPADRSGELFREQYSTLYPGPFQPRLAAWAAPDIRYQPLWFEQPGMERYGYAPAHCLQPYASAVRFGTSFLTLPITMVVQPSWSCESPWGWCRPGSVAPRVERRVIPLPVSQ